MSKPAGSHIPLSVPHLAGREWEYIKQCLDDNWVSSAGPFVNKFETAVASYVGARFGIATVNGTAAIHTCLLVRGVQPNDEVVVPALTFIAPVNAIRYCGAWPVFVDVDRYFQMDVEKLADFLHEGCFRQGESLINKASGRRVSALLPVHLLGHPVDMDPLQRLAQEYGLKIIEDATESLGAEYKTKKVGCSGEMAAFSFNGNKVITTGGGGMIVTDNPDWAAKAKYLTTQAKDDEVGFVHNEVGFNYRLTNIQAAMGLAQMEQLDLFLERKSMIATEYRKSLDGKKGFSFPEDAIWAKSTHWLNALMISTASATSRTRLYEHLLKCNIETRPLWYPIHRLPPYRDCFAYKIERVNELHDQVLTLPSSVGLEPNDQSFVITEIISQG